MPWILSTKIAVAILLLLASQYHLFSRFSSGSVFSPEFPRIVVMLFNWGFGAILLLAIFQLITDLGILVMMLFKHQQLAIPSGLRLGIGAVALFLAGLGVIQAARVPPLKDVEFAINDLPPQFDGYQILHLTDLHISRLFDKQWTKKVVSQSNELGVDLVVITGDLIDGSVTERSEDIKALSDLWAPDGVYVTPGNHEYFFDNEAWMQHYISLGMRPLANSHTTLERNGSQIVLAGVTDLTAPETGFPPPDLKKALAGVPQYVPIILLDHQPKNARDAANQGVDLQLSGHTHGGMILGLDQLVALVNGGFVSGRYQIADMQLYVSNGTALWPGFALRLGRPAELTRITLRRAVKSN
ncbi:metallophosphoesterase [Vibrio sp. ABG19]|uniref:metallophosphoesterase n=1 Tax=Vibrio sp. ABG19 TaxID=2817385 RepID=UPI00249F79F3|nr:metallophosphoesterase [Vibrio sp. ABG19]WGY47163.1 metallophosphoesterase [Vibrio sp. ABG19]